MLTEAEVSRIATDLQVTVPMVKAMADVESSGSSFLPDGRVPILFEALWFHHFTKGVYDLTHPGISSPVWDQKLYKGGVLEYDRLDEASALDRTAALMSISMGAFQVMGFNFAEVGFTSVQAMFTAMQRPEGQDAAFEAYIRKNGLIPAMQAHDFRTIALVYNGPGQVDLYAAKLDKAYSHYLDGGQPRVVLSLGSKGANVMMIQKMLGVTPDGVFGPGTELAVRSFQTAQGLPADGIVGDQTLIALKATLPKPVVLSTPPPLPPVTP